MMLGVSQLVKMALHAHTKALLLTVNCVPTFARVEVTFSRH